MTANLEEALRPLVAKLVAEEIERRAAAPADEYLTAAAAAELASVAPGTIRRWVAEGRLPGRGTARALRIRRSELDAFLGTARRRSPAAANMSPEQRAARRLG